MLTEQTLELARKAAAELRARGEFDSAAAVEALLAATANGHTPLPEAPAAGGRSADLLGATGQMIRAWVESGQFTEYHVGPHLTIPASAVEEYVRLAGSSLDLEDYSPEEAARLVSEGRHDS